MLKEGSLKSGLSFLFLDREGLFLVDLASQTFGLQDAADDGDYTSEPTSSEETLNHFCGLVLLIFLLLLFLMKFAKFVGIQDTLVC